MAEKSQKLNISVVVVVYNTSCTEAPTCRALLDIDDPSLHVIIYDNSTRDYGNKDFCEAYHWNYLGGTGNAGLSKAYNAAVDFTENCGRDGLLCLFDDDTYVDKAYFDQLRASYDESNARIYVPFIHSAGKLLSPSLITRSGNYDTFADQEAVSAYKGDDMTAINSGMAIDMRIFADYRYDEKIFLDGVDHQFLYDCKDRGITLCVFNYHCNHMFSGDAEASYSSAINRFRIYVKDYRYIYRNYLWGFMKREGKRALFLTKRYKKPQFMMAFLKVLLQKTEKN